MPTSVEEIGALVVPLILIPTMYWIFRISRQRFGHPLGYFLAFVVYWVAWCLLTSAIWLRGMSRVTNLFTPMPALSELDWKIQALLWWPLIFPLIFVFVPRVTKAGPAILAASIALGVIIGVTEEILWRGLYIRLFPDNFWLSVVYPAFMFALWHICPLSIVPNRRSGGTVSFVIYAFFLGLTYALAAQMIGSIAWSTVSHVVHDSLGLGGFAYSAWLDRLPGLL
jgi:membrane protease YdiL (CAAX protease family)